VIVSGVPPEFRPDVWFACSGAAQLQGSQDEHYYTGLVESFSRIDLENPKDPKYVVADQISRDLKRTFPFNCIIKSEFGQEKLRRVLGAFSERNERIGYCQSMNFIAAMLLVFYPENEERLLQ
jgi:TBC1 domain family member 2A